MQSGSLAPGVREWALRVVVNGVQRVAASVSIDADVASDLPDSVAGVSGVSARTGSIVWAPQNPVSERPDTPWTRVGAWPPQPGDTVGIWAGDGTSEWKVFTGRIDSSEGDTVGFSSKIVDATDQLDRPVSLDPVAHTMPGAYDEASDSAEPPVQTFVQPWHAAYRALRAGGFGVAAPAQVGGSRILDVDFQGSIWPTLGVLHYDSIAETAMEWGEGWTYLAEGSIRYRPRRVAIGSGEGIRSWSRMAAISGRTARTLLRYENERHVRVDPVLNTAMTQLTVTVEVWQGVPTSGGTLVSSGSVTVPAVVEDGSVWLDVLLPAGSSTARLAVATASESVGTPNSAVEVPISVGTALPSGAVSQIAVASPMVAVRAGIQALAQWRAMSSQMPRALVRAWGRGLVNSQYVSRTQVKRNARDLLAEIGQATLTAMWIDELGVMQWAPTNVMYLGEPVRTFTTQDDIFELGWVESLQATRHQVRGKFENAALNISNDGYTVTLYRPDSTDSITGPLEEFIETPNDREWFGVDTTMWRASAVQDRYNAGKGSFYSAVKEFGQDNYAWVGSEYSATLEQITPVAWKLTHANTAGKIELMTHPDSTSLRRSLRGQPAPIIRGLGHIRLMEETVTGDTTGPSWAPDMEVDFGAWAIKGYAQSVTNWLSNTLSRTLVTLTNVTVDYDPRVQLGDVVAIESVALLGMSIKCVVVGKSETHGRGATMSLTVRVIGTTTLHTTYEAFEAAYTGQQYAAVQSAWADANYGSFENSPLGRI